MRAGSLLADTGADSSTAHQVSDLIVLSSIPLPSIDTPKDGTNGTKDDGTADTHANADDDLFLV